MLYFNLLRQSNKPVKIKNQSNGIVTKLCHFLAFRWLLMTLQHLGKHR